MAKVVKGDSATPVKQQLRLLLLEEIQAGSYKAGQKIPSERDLAMRYRASRASVREALGDLIAEGVLMRTGARGTFVAQPRAARSKPSGPHRQIGFWISDKIFHFVQSGYNLILTGVDEVARQRGFSVRFHAVNEQKRSIDLLFGERSDAALLSGNIVAGGVPRDVMDRLRDLGSPLAIVDTLLSSYDDAVDSVRIDYASGTRQAVEHLVRLGHREIGFVGFPGSQKYEGFWMALEEFGIPFLPRFVHFLDMPDLAPGILAGFQAANRMLAANRLPTAIVAINDQLAVGIVEALSIAGYKAPDDVSVVGFDDLGQGQIQMTTVRVDLAGVGRIAAETLLSRLDHPEMAPRRVIVPVELIRRASTTAPRTAATVSS